MLRQSLDIEFLGGPYDGHVQPCFTRIEDIAANVAWLVCEDVFRLLGGDDHSPIGSITSVALYELDVRSRTLCYRFAGAISIEELETGIRAARVEARASGPNL